LSHDLQNVAILLTASIVLLICKSLGIKASAKTLHVNAYAQVTISLFFACADFLSLYF